MNSCKKPEDSFNTGFVGSVNSAIEGVVHTLKSERNMRIHFLFGFFVILFGIYLNLPSVEFMLLCFAVGLVLVAEMFNTAIEHIVDLISEEYHPVAKIVKDITAGAVFVSAINAAIVGYMILFRRVVGFMGGAFSVIKQSSWHITLIALLIVVGTVLLVKILRKEKQLLRGGMPSGHSAVAFGIWVIISLITANVLVSVLVFFLAMLLARSRLKNGIHNIWEIIAGSLLGTLLTLLAFQLLS